MELSGLFSLWSMYFSFLGAWIQVSSNKDSKQVCILWYSFYVVIISYKYQRALFGSDNCEVFSISGRSFIAV